MRLLGSLELPADLRERVDWVRQVLGLDDGTTDEVIVALARMGLDTLDARTWNLPPVEDVPAAAVSELYDRARMFRCERQSSIARMWLQRALAVAERDGKLVWIAHVSAELAIVEDGIRHNGAGLREGAAHDHRRRAYAALMRAGAVDSTLGRRLRDLLEQERRFPTVFLSYDSQQKELVEAVGAALMTRVPDARRRILLDAWDFAPGYSLSAQINAAIDRCSVVVVFLTERYLTRPFCQLELARVMRAGGAECVVGPPRIIFVLLPGVSTVPDLLGDDLCVDGRDGVTVDGLVAAIARSVGLPDPENPPSTT